MSDELSRGPYVQLSKVLRIQRGPGNADLESERPVKLNAKKEVVGFLDDPVTNPTLVTFDELCDVNIRFLLRTGAIREYVAPAPSGPTSPQPSTRRRSRGKK